MTDLRDPLDDLLAEIPAYVVPDASAAWGAGARRRTRRRAGVAVAVVVAIGLVAGLAQVLPRPRDVPPAEEPGSIGYPAHVDKPWFLHDLPEQPGPISAVLRFDAIRWVAVSPSGDVWELPSDGFGLGGYPPALSDDGRRIGYLAGPSTYVVRDLVTGKQTTFDDVTVYDQGQARPGAFGLSPASPAFWSPDGTRLVVAGAQWVAGVHVHALVLGTDGTETKVRDVPRYPIGWLDDDTVAWLDGNRLVATDPTGKPEGTQRLPVSADGLDQWSAALSPDRSRVAVVLPNAAGTLVTAAVGTGEALGRENVGAPGFCLPAWVGDQPAFFQDHGVDTTTGQRTIVADPAIPTTCILAAADALAGPRHERFGDRLFHDAWLSWHWREVGLGLLALLLLVAGGVALLSARSRRRSA